MKATNIILAGIAFILFGSSCFTIAAASGWGIFELLGLLCPFIGLGFVIDGILKNR